MSAPIVLVPGFWLGAWAWDEVAATLRADGHDVTALTLPGLEDPAADRASVRLVDHVDAICDAVRAQDRSVVLAVHSGAGVPGYAATDRVHQLLAHVVYVDTGPATAALDPTFTDDELPLPPAATLADEENLDGLSDEHLTTFRTRAVPQPGAALRDDPVLTDGRRTAVPSTVVATGFPAAAYREAAASGQTWLGGLTELEHVTWVELPTSHWPMWSRPAELAAIIGEVANAAD